MLLTHLHGEITKRPKEIESPMALIHHNATHSQATSVQERMILLKCTIFGRAERGLSLASMQPPVRQTVNVDHPSSQKTRVWC